MNNLIKKQEKKFTVFFKKQFNVNGWWNISYNVKKFIAKLRKEAVEFERKRIIEIIKDMSDAYPLYESDMFDKGMQKTKRDLLNKLK